MTTPAAGIFWRARIIESFDIALACNLGLAAPLFAYPPHGEGTAALSLTPSLGMIGHGSSVAACDLSLTPTLPMTGIFAGLDLALTPQIIVTGAERYARSADLSLTSSIGASAVGHNAPTFDAVGPGVNQASGTTQSWSHTTSGTDRAVLMAVVVVSQSAGMAGTTRTATYDGNAMTSLAAVEYYYDGFVTWAWVELFGILAPASGTKTAAITCSPGYINIAANTVSYDNISSFSSGSTNTGSGTSLSHSVSSATGRLIVQAFASAGVPTLSAYNQTQRYLRATGSTSGEDYVIGDALGASSVSFTATLSVSNSWGSAAVSLLPL